MYNLQCDISHLVQCDLVYHEEKHENVDLNELEHFQSYDLSFRTFQGVVVLATKILAFKTSFCIPTIMLPSIEMRF